MLDALGLNMQRRLRSVFDLIIKSIAVNLAKIFTGYRKERIWLIACGGERWGDSADALWRYMIKNHPEIKTIAVLKNKVAINDHKNWVKRNSLSNYRMILTAEVLATTHSLSDIGPESLTSASRAKKVWLQHGVIAIGKLTAVNAKKGKYDFVCVSSMQEKKILTELLGINPDIIFKTGLARHDLLREKLKRQSLFREGVFYLPTSRAWLDATRKKEYERLLFAWIKEINKGSNSINIKLWLHPGWYKVGLDKLGSECNNIKACGLDQDPQNLLLESRLLVTDYSSVFFDAALAGIPTIFYQPDKASYVKEKGLFKDFLEQDNLFVTENQDELLLLIAKIINDSSYYQERVEKDQKWAYKYVETFDGNCSKRIYQQVNKML